MGLRINTNVASLRAQRALAETSKKRNTAMTRLSTGLRISTGSDDVVGLAKSESLRTRIRGITQAQSNIGAATSVLGVAEGYLSQLTEIAQNLREIAVQAADGTISASDRSSLTDKFNSQLDEYNRQTSTANFNGVKLLDGTFSGKTVQVGTQEGDTIGVSIGDARSSVIGQVAVLTAQTRTAVITTTTTTTLSLADPSSIEIAGVSIASSAFSDDGVSNIEGADSAIAYVNAINSYSGETGVTAQVQSNVVTASYTAGNNLTSALNLIINGVTVKDTTTAYTSSDDDIANLLIVINNYSSQTGVVATQDSSSNKLILTASDGRNIDVTVTGADTTISSNVFGLTGSSSNRAVVFRGTFTLTSDEAFSVNGAAGEFASGAAVSVSIDSSTSLTNASLASADSAGAALTILEYTIQQLQSRRAEVGSAQNRFETSNTALAALYENFSAADSQIRDADIAAETANYTQANILQQAGVAVLSQANSAPEIALQLLQNL